jgi:PAS domain S-box-containing protein
MSPVGSSCLRLGIVGEEAVVEGLSGWSETAGRSLDVDVVDPETVADSGTAARDVDALVVDSSVPGIDSAGLLDRWTAERPDLPVVVLVDGWDDERVADALSAGAAGALPRRLVDDDPALVADRIVAAVERRTRAYEPVSDRREYERRLERERDRRSVLFENNPDPVVRIRFEGGEPVIREVNPAFERVFGFAPAAVVGSSVAEALVPDDARAEHERLRETVARGEPLEREAPRKTADGIREFLFRVIHFSTEPDAESATDAYVWYTDVTDRKRRERIVRRLHESTEAIQNAETEREVCEATVDAAREVLDLSAPTCWFETDDGEALTPVAGPDGGRGPSGGLETGTGTLEPGDRAYAAYAEGEARVLEPGERPDALPDGAAVLVPLGDDGLFGAADPGRDGIDDVTLDAARILARHGATALDRVERRRELRESERRLQLIADHVDEVIFLSEPDFSEVFYVNAAYESIWGEPTEALYDDPRGFVDRIDPRDRERFETEFEAMLADIDRGEADDSYVFEYRVRPAEAEGTVRWVRATGYPVELEPEANPGRASDAPQAHDGDPDTRFVGIVEDVTERRELERTYRGVFENVSDGLVIHDPETGEIRDVNDQFCEMNGYDREELVGETIDVVTGPEHAYERAQERIRAARESGPQLFEWRNQRKDGETFPVEVHLSVVDVRGEERVLGSVRDITERKRREREYEQIFDGVNESIVVQDPETAEPVDANETFLDRLGYDDVAEVRREGFEELTAAEAGYTRERARELCHRVMETGEPETVEWQQETRAGDRRWIEAKVDSAVIQGEDRILSMQRDVTERKRRERTVRALHESTDDLHDAETPREVCAAAVDAAGEVLELSAPTCWLHGTAEPEVLTPVATAGETADEDEAEGPPSDGWSRTEFEPGDVAYGVYEAGETSVTELDGATAAGAGGHADGRSPGDAVLVPMGEHGLFGAIERGGGFDDVTLDAAQILARHVASALDRVERARELRESERRFRLIADHVDEIVYLATADFSEILYINPAYEELYGRPVEELEERPTAFVEAAHPDDRDRYEADLERLIEDVEAGRPQDAYEGQYRIERDGEVRWVTVTRFPVANGEGEVDRIVGRVQDVTERTRREREYEQIYNGVTDAIAVHDPETGEFVDVNDTYVEQFGYDVDAIRELGIEGLSVTEEGFTRARGTEIHERVVETGEPETVEWKVRHADGEERVYEVTATAATIGGEQRVLTINHDITERRRREREYEQIFEGVNDSIAIHDPETGELVDVNSTMCELTGYDRETILERGAEGLLVGDPEADFAPEQVPAVIDRVMGGEEISPYEQVVETSDGDRVWLEVNPTRAVIGGEERFLAISRDITERKRREREYEQIFDGVNDAITVHDPETAELLDVNETFCELLGYDREEILEMGIEGYSPSDGDFTMEAARAFVREVVESNDPRQTEWVVETRDGERRWLDVKGTTVEIGGELRYVSIDRDVTERRRTERRLGEILDRIGEAIFMTRAEEITAPSQSPDYVSSGYEAIWGQSLDEIRETHEEGFFDTLHPDDADDYRAFVEGVVDDVDEDAAADSYSQEYRIERPDGEVRWVRSDYYPTEWESGRPRIVIVSRDVTDRKSRERRIASFDDATDDLATADTPAEATRTAVEAATETLDLPAVGAFLYDSDDGVLLPEVLAGPLPGDVATDPIGPGDGPLWEGFATGTIVAPDGGRSEPGFVGEAEDGDPPEELADLAEWRALALGNHGMLLVGSPDSSLASETIQAAHVLAATLEAALNHLEGQQRLAAQEEQLRTQTERAERLDRIARLTQQVEAAITDASSPGEVERAVCERLASSGPYDLAWVGGMDVGSDRLATRAVVGASSQYVESLDLTTTDDTADPHPAVEAWETGEVRVADSLVSDGPVDDWRRHGLSHGVQSLCAVPLTYDGITHGVLTVGTDSPNAFTERERDVLSQLGTSIANGLAAIERRRALESDETVELEFRGPGDALSVARAAGAADCRVRLERTVARQDGPVSVYVSFEGDVPEEAPAIASRTLPGTVDVVAEESSSTLVETRTTDWFGSPLAEYGGVLRDAVAEPGETTVTVEVPRQADVRSFVERLREIAPTLELVAKRQHSRRDRTPAEFGDRIRAELTDRQFEVLQTALSAGYFEWPRDNDGSTVADRLDITQPTFNKHMRLAEQKTFELLFDDS